ncbi:MAG: hypothetical protein J6A42_02180 [Firmicutes bacterium]|nr:hypothetical protein [Bacillota bacterium]
MRKDNVFKVIACCLGVLAGIMSVYWGYSLSDHGAYSSYAKFGADFYTEIYDATRNAGNNIIYVIDGVSHVLVVAGLAMIGSFGFKLVDCLPGLTPSFSNKTKSATGDTVKAPIDEELPDLNDELKTFMPQKEAPLQPELNALDKDKAQGITDELPDL